MNSRTSRPESTPNTGHYPQGVVECSGLGAYQLEFVVEPGCMQADVGGGHFLPVSSMERNVVIQRLKW